MKYVLIIYLAIGSSQVEYGLDKTECAKRLAVHTARYTKTYVVESSGCFPEQVIQRAVKPVQLTQTETR